jgi:hypothetical protein
MKRHSLPSIIHKIFEKENKILMQRRYNTGFENGKFDFPFIMNEAGDNGL